MSNPKKADQVVIDRAAAGQPHKGKVFVAIHSHLDDVPRYCAGTLAKLIREGYTGYLIRASNDEQRGEGTAVQNINSCEAEHAAMAAGVGVKEVYDFYYRDHCMGSISTQEFRFRLVFLLRRLRPDTVLSFSPWGEGEGDPDHRVTGIVAEEACRMSGASAAYPELAQAGLPIHQVPERYYLVSQPAQPFNRVVDIGPTIEEKIAALVKCPSRGVGSGSRLRAALAHEGKRLPILGDSDQRADREYVRHFLLREHQALGERYGLKFAEAFHYLDQRTSAEQAEVARYVKENAVPI
jgi:LmbE family N-acetylglucosaminyl deacetylase